MPGRGGEDHPQLVVGVCARSLLCPGGRLDPDAWGDGDDAPEYLSDGTESLILRLSQLSTLRVMARSTVFRYKGRGSDPQAVGRDLGVRAVLTGRVDQRGDVLIIQAEIVNVDDGSLLWGKRYNRRLADIFAIQEELSTEISEALRLRLTREDRRRLAHRHTNSAEAYQLYLKGRYLWNQRTSESVLRKGIEYFEQARGKDPRFALAHVGLSDSYSTLGVYYYGFAPPREAFPRAKEAALEALAIDERLGEAHTSLAYVKLFYDWDWAGAEQEFKRALELNPMDLNARHWYSHYHLALGGFSESVAESRRAVEVDPISLVMSTHLGEHYNLARGNAPSSSSSGLSSSTRTSRPRTFTWGTRTSRWGGMRRRSRSSRRRGSSIVAATGRGPQWRGFSRGPAASARPGAPSRELEGGHGPGYLAAHDIAGIHIGLGEADRAFEWLDKAFEERSSLLVYLGVEPIFDDLRTDPRFAPLKQRVGLTA
jgi:TolB-like protein